MTTPDIDDFEPHVDVPPFDWDDVIPTSTLITIASFGDQEMRLRAAASPSLTVASARALLQLGDPEITGAIRANPHVSPRVAQMAAISPHRFNRSVRRAISREEARAEKGTSGPLGWIRAAVTGRRSTYVSTGGGRHVD